MKFPSANGLIAIGFVLGRGQVAFLAQALFISEESLALNVR